MRKIIFITGTDTGVGKTVLTALLLQHLRDRKVHALAMKPFCSGNRNDVQMLQSLQLGEISDEEMNPYYFSESLAPYVAAKNTRKKIISSEVSQKIFSIRKRCDVLLIEGAGGVMVPLGKDFLIRDLIEKLRCGVVLVAPNKLGTLNHSLLSALALKESGVKELAIVLMDDAKDDLSSSSNGKILQSFVPFAVIFSVPFLGRKIFGKIALKNNCKKIKKTLASISNSV